MGHISELLEIVMLLCFGASWPLNVLKSYRSRTVKGKSLAFLILIDAGYVAGIVSKFANKAFMADIGSKWYVLFFYFLNFAMVLADICLYFRNKRLMKAESGKTE